MAIELYDFWRYIHILLFVYWLGGDLGVFHAASNVARADLPTDERLRFLELLLKLDMGPRTGLILLLPVGFQLSYMTGLVEVPDWTLAAIWLSGLAWLAIAWTLYLKHGQTPRPLQTTDMIIRVAVVITMAGLGLWSLTTAGLFATGWLSLKAVFYAAAVAVGLYLRTFIASWAQGFALLRAGERVDEANAMIAKAGRESRWWALLLWAFVAIVAFLGVTKPI